MEAIKMSTEDKQLEEIFHGEEKPLHPDTVHVTLGKPSRDAIAEKKPDSKRHAEEKKTAQKPNEKPMDAEYKPVKTWYDEKAVNMVKWVVVFMGMEYLFFYWQQTGQMQSTAAVPSMIVCALLAGISVGKNWKWKM